MYKKFIKRFLDIIFSILLLILLCPVFLIVGLIVFFDLGRPIIFKQKRVGKNKKVFTMYKFRSMDEEKNTTKISHILRKLGLDEITQLINILKGDMSFVGFRPFIEGEVLPITPRDKMYEVSPGVVSLATSKGRRFISHKKRLEYDYYYTDNISFLLDLKIIFKTLFVIIKQFNN